MKVIVKPALCFDGYGSQDIADFYEDESGHLFVTLHSTCYKCHKPIVARFMIWDAVTERFNQAETTTVRCVDCNVYMKKSILVSIIDEDKNNI